MEVVEHITASAMVQFPSPRGVELHKPRKIKRIINGRLYDSFRPLAGLSCINLRGLISKGKDIRLPCFRPLAGLSCINLVSFLLEHFTIAV